jgi:hypothetical protein
MIYILSGNDIKQKNAYIKKISSDSSPVLLSDENIKKESILEYAEVMSLFGDSLFVIIENFLKSGIKLSSEEIKMMEGSKTTFVLLEEKLLASDVNKFKKYAKIEDLNLKITKEKQKFNVFSIAEAFARRDKMGTWILYKEAISLGSSPEEIAGIIFWKIKTMIISGNKFFTKDELRVYSSELVTLYHLSHLGKRDFVIGLEQFILSSLDKR